jgi:F-type H+-transporting ATPase subunit delta
MAIDPIASRYATALFESAKASNELDTVLDQLLTIGQLIRQHHDLRQLMNNPDVDPDQKVGIVERLIGTDWTPLMREFISMVVERARPEHLPEMGEALQALVDAERGHVRVRVRSARPLTAEALSRIREGVRRREGKEVTVETEMDPQLIGGVQVVLGHRVFDASVRRQLADLRERLASVRVL